MRSRLGIRTASAPLCLVAALAALAAATGAGAQPGSAAPLLRAFFEALNSDRPEAMAEFAEQGMTEEFRARRSAEEDRALYDRLRSELGRLEVESMERLDPSRARVSLRSEKVPMAVEFQFDLAGGRIDGFSVQVGGPPGGGRERLLELPASADDEALGSALDGQLRELAAADRFSGVVLLARGGEPVFHRAYGVADRSSGRPMEITTQLDVGSITKLLTKIAVGQLVQAGKLGLDDELGRHLPSYPNPEVARRVTLRQLVEHSSGMGDIFGPRWAAADKSRFVEPADFFPLFADQPLAFEPGAGRAYSNAGYITLGAVVAAVSGRSYFDYVEERIFRPAGMTRSGFAVRDGSNPALAIGYTRGGPEGPAAGGELQANLGLLPIRGCPAGSSSHAAADLLALDRALRGGRLLDAERTAWVLGVAAGEDPARALVGIAGGGPGVSAGWESNGEVTAIVLANLDPPAGEGLAMELYRALSGP